jgi:hypothetical protein
MHDEHQTEIPPSFIALYIDPGRSRPNASRAVIGARYEFCEDLATILTEHASTMLFDLGISEEDVLERCHRGLCIEGSAVSLPEAEWVTRRLAELQGWSCPSLTLPSSDDPDAAAS